MTNGAESFPRENRLLSKEAFDLVFREGVRKRGATVTLFIRKNDLGIPRLGVVLKRAYGNARQRNRFRRLIREVFRRNKGIVGPRDLVVIPRPLARDSDQSIQYKDVQRELLGLLSEG